MISGLHGALLLAVLVPAAAPAAHATAPLHSEGQDVAALPALKPGQSIWFDTPELIKANAGTAAPVRVVIALQQQRALVYHGDRLVGVSTVSTGAPGYETPLGEFTILQKQEFHRSNLYSDAPMPFMQRLTWDGIALHAGQLPGRPASHGCIRLPKTFARQLYGLTELGGTVIVVDDVLDAPLYLPVAPLLTADTRGLGGPATSHTPSAGPSLAAETRNLGGAAYDVLTLGGDPPADAARRPASWVAGSAGETSGSSPEPGTR